ncbi:hypothetical protein WI41_15735 [Burkholderia latens]|uniref:Uncharacterized protein n=1 Tax=Burkholderia latens TaxID=488446 RepID=A0AAP1G9D9_9BURK|nr:hypothetical protein DM40_5097 [Burkholderia cenocepacia]KVA06650.1 hypothetical protein WI41_15735 [Burkholderia latens]
MRRAAPPKGAVRYRGNRGAAAKPRVQRGIGRAPVAGADTMLEIEWPERSRVRLPDSAPLARTLPNNARTSGWRRRAS